MKIAFQGILSEKGFSNKKYKEAQCSELVNKKILRSKYEGFYHLLVKLNCLQKESKIGPCFMYPTITEVNIIFLSVMLASKFTRVFKKV